MSPRSVAAWGVRVEVAMSLLAAAPRLLALLPDFAKGASIVAKSKSQASNRPQKTASHTSDPDKVTREQEQRDEENKRRFVDQSGIVAQDLPEAAHGQNAVPDAHEMQRNLPQQHGGELGGEGGMRGDRDITDADDHGGRKHN
jgi:hypothetical protein